MAAAPKPLSTETLDHKRYFFAHFGLTERLLERCLGEALSAGGEFADLYFEAVTSTSLGMDEGIVKSATQGISVGCGIRVLSGERTGFAYTDELSPERLLRAARTAALIACGPQASAYRASRTTRPRLYPMVSADAEIAAKLKLIERANKAARDFSPSILQVRVGINDELRRILIAASDGTFASDTQPLARFNVFVIAKDAQHRQGHQRRRRSRRHRLRGLQKPRRLRPRGRPQRHPAARRRPRPRRRNGSGPRPRLARHPAA